MKKIFLCLFLLVHLPAQSFAAEEPPPTIRELIKDATDNSVVKRFIYVSGISLRWANARLQEEGKPLLYCEPPGNIPKPDEYFTLLEQRVKDWDYVASDRATAFPRHLLDALVERYPCK